MFCFAPLKPALEVAFLGEGGKGQQGEGELVGIGWRLLLLAHESTLGVCFQVWLGFSGPISCLVDGWSLSRPGPGRPEAQKPPLVVGGALQSQTGIEFRAPAHPRSLGPSPLSLSHRISLSRLCSEAGTVGDSWLKANMPWARPCPFVWACQCGQYWGDPWDQGAAVHADAHGVDRAWRGLS